MQSSSATLYGNSSSSYLFAAPPSPSGAASASSSLRNSSSRSPSTYYGSNLPPEPVLSATRSPQMATPADPYHQRQYALKPVRSKADLQPQIHSQQKYRRVDEDGKFVSPLHLLTLHLTDTYRQCNPAFAYKPTQNPRRVLTKPSKGVKNDGYDNEDGDYILCVNDILGNDERHRYRILDMLGSGTFGQVVKCQNLKTNEFVAVKVVKNKPAYHNQSLMEVAILELLNGRYDVTDEHHILRLLDHFTFRSHLCLVFELMSVNLYELIKQNQFRGLSTNLVRVFTAQMLDALTVLNEAKIIHCDLKPENVLLKNLESPTIKIIDFGSACHEHKTIYTYIQSRFYRSPEVLLGLPYSSAIDMWSLGCIAAELFLGLPLFPGSSEYNQISRIVEMLGYPPSKLIEFGKTASNFFNRIPSETGGRPKFTMKTLEEYSRENNTQEKPSKRYFNATTLPDIVQNYPVTRKGLSAKEVEKEKQNRLAFIDFLHGLLNLNPFERWSPQQAKLHPFITGEKFTGKFQPPMLFTGRSSRASTSSVASGTTSLATGGAVSDQVSQSHLSPAQIPASVPAAVSTRQRSSTISGAKVPMNMPPKMQQLSAVNEQYEVEKQLERKQMHRRDDSNGMLADDPNHPTGKPMHPSASLPAAFNEYAQLPYSETGRAARPAPSPRNDAPPLPPLPNTLGVLAKRSSSKSPRDRGSYLPEARHNASPSGRARAIPESDEDKLRMIREENKRFAEKLAAEATVPAPAQDGLAPPSTPQRTSVASYMRQSLSRRSSQAQDGPPDAHEEAPPPPPEENRTGVLSNLMKRSSALLGSKKRQQQQPGTAMMKTVSTSVYEMSSHSTPPMAEDGYAVPYGQSQSQPPPPDDPPFLTVTSKKNSRKSTTFQQVQQHQQQQQQQANQGVFKRRGSYDVTNMGGKAFEAYQQQKAAGQTSQGSYRRRGSYDMTAGMGYDPNSSPRQTERRVSRGGDGSLQPPSASSKASRRQTYQQGGQDGPRHKVPPPLKIPNANEVPQGHFLHSSTLPPSTPNELPMSPTVYTRPAAPAPPGSSAAQTIQPGVPSASYGSRAYKTRSQSMSASNKDMYAMTAAAVQSAGNYPPPSGPARFQDRRTSMRPAPKPEPPSNYSRGFSFDEFPPLPSAATGGAGAGRWRRPSNQAGNATQQQQQEEAAGGRGLKEWVDEQSQRNRQMHQDY